MKAFLSYSFKDSELYVISLLLEQLRNKGYIVETSNSVFSHHRENKITHSDVFIGIVTNDSNSINHVLEEWEIAHCHEVKRVLLIEDGITVEDPEINYIRFSRSDPNPAIEKLFGRAKATPSKKGNSTGAVEDALIAGGIVVGLAALIALLAGSGKK